MFEDLSDETLMLRYQKGELAAFNELYRRHSRGLYLFISWRSPRKDWAEEIAQDSWASLHQARARYQPQSSFRTYLFQIARNRLIDILRQHQIVLASELGAGEDGQPVFDHLADLGTDDDGDAPDARLESRQRARLLQQAMQALPPEQREALVLQQFNDMSLDEIAQVTGVPAETVKSRLRYAMRKLRAALDRTPQEEVSA